MGRGIDRRDPSRRGDAVDARHPDVHQDHVGAERFDEGDGLRSVTGLGDDLDVRFGLEDRAEAAAHERFVVGEQDSDHGAASGRRARTR